MTNNEIKMNGSLLIIKSKLLPIFWLILIVNGCSPYLGLKNTTDWSMYSNLKIDINENNHLFMPKMIVTDYFYDVVCIQDISNNIKMKKK
eukprot:270759_1